VLSYIFSWILPKKFPKKFWKLRTLSKNLLCKIFSNSSKDIFQKRFKNLAPESGSYCMPMSYESTSIKFCNDNTKYSHSSFTGGKILLKINFTTMQYLSLVALQPFNNKLKTFGEVRSVLIWRFNDLNTRLMAIDRQNIITTQYNQISTPRSQHNLQFIMQV